MNESFFMAAAESGLENPQKFLKIFRKKLFGGNNCSVWLKHRGPCVDVWAHSRQLKLML